MEQNLNLHELLNKTHKNGLTVKLKKISVHDQMFKKLKNQKLHIEKEIYKTAKYEVQKLISYGKVVFEKKINDAIGKAKEL